MFLISVSLSNAAFLTQKSFHPELFGKRKASQKLQHWGVGVIQRHEQ
jgi:hypothetical protein